MSIIISEAELLGMPEKLLLELRSYLKSVRRVEIQKAQPAETEAVSPVTPDGVDSQTADKGPEPWNFPEHRLRITETLDNDMSDGLLHGLRIEQELEGGSGRAYIASQWRLNNQLREIVDLALNHGFDKLWREGHPRDAYVEGNHKYKYGVKHIAFSRSHTDRWVFAVDVSNSKPPDVRAVVFEKQHQKLVEVVLGKGLPRAEPAQPGRWKWEAGGGKNILVDPPDVEKILKELNR